jgi:PAS domain-containing protein
MSEQLLPHRFLFRFALPCRHREPVWNASGHGLEEKYRLVHVGQLEHPAATADFRAAWSEAGLAFAVHVGGKRQPPWCRDTRTEDSDGLRVWIDTRDVHNVHRAGRFCHGFLFLPCGAGPRLADPVAQWMPINRAREQPRAIREGLLQVRVQRRPDGYVLDAFVPAEALTGFEPREHPRLGFNYAIVDRELGLQTFSVGHPLPYDEDPSLWATLELGTEDK